MKWRYLVIVAVAAIALASAVFALARTMPSSPTETSTTNLSAGPKAFAIFTLPYQGDIVEETDVIFTSSEYELATEIIKNHLSPQQRPAESGQPMTDADDSSPRNYIIQSIRVLARADAMENTTGPEGEKLELQGGRLFDTFDDSYKMITVQSVDNITMALGYSEEYPRVTHILYDIEHWSRTPLEEQQTPILSVGEASRRVHAGSLKYGITPDAPFLIENYEQIQWTEVDFLGMQLQRFSQNTTEFSGHVKNISSYVKAANPSTQVFVQLSFRFTDSAEMIAAIEGARPWVDGYIIAYLPSSTSCLPDCNPQALAEVLEHISRSNADR